MSYYYSSDSSDSYCCCCKKTTPPTACQLIGLENVEIVQNPIVITNSQIVTPGTIADNTIYSTNDLTTPSTDGTVEIEYILTADASIPDEDIEFVPNFLRIGPNDMEEDIPDINVTTTIANNDDNTKKVAKITIPYNSITTPQFFDQNAANGNRLILQTRFGVKRRNPDGSQFPDNTCNVVKKLQFTLSEIEQMAYIGNRNTAFDWASTRNDHNDPIIDQVMYLTPTCNVDITDMTGRYTSGATPPGYSLEGPSKFELLTHTQYNTWIGRYWDGAFVANSGFPGTPEYDQYQPQPYHIIPNVPINQGLTYVFSFPNEEAVYELDFKMTGVTENGTPDVACGTVQCIISEDNLNRQASFDLNNTVNTETFQSEEQETPNIIYIVEPWDNTNSITVLNTSVQFTPYYEPNTTNLVHNQLNFNGQAWDIRSDTTQLVTLPIYNNLSYTLPITLDQNETEKLFTIKMTNYFNTQKLGVASMLLLLKRQPERNVVFRTMNSNWLTANLYLPNTNNAVGNFGKYFVNPTGYNDLTIDRNDGTLSNTTCTTYIYNNRSASNKTFVINLTQPNAFAFTVTFSIAMISSTVTVPANATSVTYNYANNSGLVLGRNEMVITFNIPNNTSLNVSTIQTNLPPEYEVTSKRIMTSATGFRYPFVGSNQQDPITIPVNGLFEGLNASSLSNVIINVPISSKNFGGLRVIGGGWFNVRKTNNTNDSPGSNLYAGAINVQQYCMRLITDFVTTNTTNYSFIISRGSGGQCQILNTVQYIDNL